MLLLVTKGSKFGYLNLLAELVGWTCCFQSFQSIFSETLWSLDKVRWLLG